MKNTPNKPSKKEAAAARERYEQAIVDADIEGLPRSSAIEDLIAAWDAEGIDDTEQIRRLRAYFTGEHSDFKAAE